ncbi:MAG: hypothetical protein AAFX79_07255 [Planctomycetota bacterium]
MDRSGGDHEGRSQERLTSLEEAAMFQDRAVGELREVADELLKRLVSLEGRLGGLERRLGHLVDAEPNVEPDADPTTEPRGEHGARGDAEGQESDA